MLEDPRPFISGRDWVGPDHRDAVLERADSDFMVVEIGCGRAGHFVQRVAEKFKPAITIDVAMSAESRRWGAAIAVRSGVIVVSGDSWRALLGDAHKLPLGIDHLPSSWN